MILVDYSQIFMSVVNAFGDDLRSDDTKSIHDLLRHALLNTLVADYKKFKKYGPDFVLCADSRHYWRRDVFPQYKGTRKIGRENEENPINWEQVFQFLDQFKIDLKNVFGWKFIEVDGAEADDVIAILAEAFSDGSQGLPQQIVILSSDGDFRQLHIPYSNIKQWSLIQKKWVARPEPTFLIEKIIRGDSGDGIPSVLEDDNFLIDKALGNITRRAKPVTKKVLARYMESPDLLTAEELARYQRNETLISFEKIPETLKHDIISKYLDYGPLKPNIKQIFNYLVKHRCANLLDRIEDFK